MPAISAIVIAVAGLFAACKGTPEPRIGAYTMSFHQDSERIVTNPIGIKGCLLSDLYCQIWQQTTADFAGTLVANGVSVSVTIDATTYSMVGFRVDSVPNELGRGPGECGSLTVQAQSADDEIFGTWQQILGCHGQSRVGSFSGRTR